MAEKSFSQWRLHGGPYLGEISALCFLHLPSHLSSLPFLLAGSGSQIFVYDLELRKMIKSFNVFQGIRVHGITSSFIDCTQGTSSSKVAFKLAVFGEKKVKLFKFFIDVVSGYPNNSEACLDLILFHAMPKFGNWVLDVCFLKWGCLSSSIEARHCLAIGCSDNSLHIWDISKSKEVLKVQSPVRCLLYSMRLWGDNFGALRIASGTIYNEILVWRIAPQHDASSVMSRTEDHSDLSVSISNYCKLLDQPYEAVHICKLVGHQGSIFRMAWSSNGSKLVSVSDDRSAHIWEVASERDDSVGCHPVGLVLFGHNARVWDCCIVDSLIVTAGEDCTCRVWGLDGEQLEMIKEHLGRGIWRCLYDPNSTLLITAGFDSAIKVHQRHASMSMGLAKVQESIGTRQTFSICIPNMLEHVGLMNSKSEYVRCLHFTCEDSLYVATNHGYLYQAKLSDTGDARWTELMRVSDEAPIVCMDLLCKSSFEFDNQVVDWVAVGDGKGNMTIVGVISDDTPKVSVSFTWQAEMERQLLGTYWCKSLGYRYIFTADPRGKLKLWRLYDPLQSNSDSSIRRYNVSFVAEFVSSYGMRVMCLDASLEEEVLVCGDLRGNLILFPLLKDMLFGISIASEVKKSPLNYFKGAHGISSVSSVSLATLSSNQIEIRSTGADGCICYLEYDRDLNRLEFIGMKQVKELSLIQSVSVDSNSVDTLSGSYATGFASVDFIVWNLIDETKVVQIPCGGWRRPHSYYLGGVPEMNNCFAYVKDELIYVHRYRVHNRDWKIYPQSLHVQFHGREIHSLCFITEDLPLGASSQNIFSKSSWIATGCEDGTVRLTWYSPGTQNWSMSKLLGEHVGGSAVRSICCVSKLHIISSDTAKILDDRNKQDGSTEDKENPTLLISVGAKRVLTSWILRNRRLDKNKNTPFLQQYNVTGDDQYLSGLSASMSFQWLSTDMPAKYSSTKYLENLKGVVGVADDGTKINTRSEAVLSEKGNNNLVRDKYEDDWRYLAVTAFLVKCSGSRITICFVVVACSDATLTLRALVLPLRLWFDVAMLIPLSSPVLALQHVVVPISSLSKENVELGNFYIVITGSTDGSIAFWDLTESIEAFTQRVSFLNVEKFINCQKRPRTGRGSQGGRWWRSLSSSISKKRPTGALVTFEAGEKTNINMANCVTPGNLSTPNDSKDCNMEYSQATCQAPLQSEMNIDDSISEICEIQPLHVLNRIHQSGVNCLHVSEIKGGKRSDCSHLCSVVSGGDDQALHYLVVELSLVSTNLDVKVMTPDIRNSISGPEYVKNFTHYSQNHRKSCRIRFLDQEKILSAHSSAVKGVWTDGSWVFSTGLDQRVRCWNFTLSKLKEHASLIVSVPEPEALCARACGRNHYRITVAGRGMQMVEFSESCDMGAMNGEELNFC